MSFTVINSLKENFKELYDLLKNNQGPNGLIFLIPNSRFYVKTKLSDINFYYAHIFQRCKYDPTLYVNFVGKVLKSEDNKKFESYLGWTKNMTLVAKSRNCTEDNVYFYITDGICIDELTQISVMGRETDTTLDIERFNTSAEYIKHYEAQDKDKKLKKYQKAKSILKLFVSSMKNNNILMKGHEDSYSKIFQENISNLISIFFSIFKNNEIAKEYVDTFVYKNLYDDIMTKLRKFYEEEEKELAKNLSKNMDKFEIDTLKLPKSIAKCNFDVVYNGLKNLYDYKTCFEKKNYLNLLNKQLIEIVKESYEKETGKQLETQGDLMVSCWLYVITRSKVSNLIAEALFFKNFQINKGFGEDDYVVNNFIVVMEQIQNELLKKENDVNIHMAKPFEVETPE